MTDKEEDDRQPAYSDVKTEDAGSGELLDGGQDLEERGVPGGLGLRLNSRLMHRDDLQ